MIYKQIKETYHFYYESRQYKLENQFNNTTSQHKLLSQHSTTWAIHWMWIAHSKYKRTTYHSYLYKEVRIYVVCNLLKQHYTQHDNIHLYNGTAYIECYIQVECQSEFTTRFTATIIKQITHKYYINNFNA